MQDNNESRQFHHQVRIRVCGILIENDEVLLLKHKGIGRAGHLWSFPGGGMEFGESAILTLKREFLEEVNLKIAVGDYLFTNEYMDQLHHAMEIFFQVSRVSGQVKLGMDPELSSEQQILADVDFFDSKTINQVANENKHNIFHDVNQVDKLLKLKGFYFFNNF